MPSQTGKSPLHDAGRVFAAITVATLLLTGFESSVPILRDNLHLVVGALFLLTAITRAERLPGGLPRYGLALGGLLLPAASEPAGRGPLAALRDLSAALLRALPSFLREAAVAGAVCAVVFPPFVLGFFFWNAPSQPFHLVLPHDFGAYLATQIVVVGLPEEALFRGYLQGRLHDAWSKRRRVLGAELSPLALLTQAALFALLHFAVDLEPARLAVFFPALLFGWLSALRSGIGAAILVHAACNVLSDLLARGWF